jgi:membrane protein DedA with SNARE-associated domain
MWLEQVMNIVSNYGYIGLFGLLMFGIVGLPVPDEILMTLAGYFITLHKLRYLPTVLIAILGSMTGMSFSFLIGRYLGAPFLHRYGKFVSLTPERYKRVDKWFERFGQWTVTFGYFIPGIRHLTALSAGISRWTFRTFVIYAFLGSVIWVMTFVNLGVFFGKHWREYTLLLHKSISFLFVAVLVAVCVWWGINRMMGKSRS